MGYETQQMEPIAQIEGMHYANMSDLAWSPDGNHLFVSSRDGYVSRIDFDSGDLGVRLEKKIEKIKEENFQKIIEAATAEAEVENLNEKIDTENEENRLSPKLEQ